MQPAANGRYKSVSSKPLYSSAAQPLFTDVLQGKTSSDCSLMALLAALAKDNPAALSGRITQLPNGNFTVLVGSEVITIDAQLPVNSYGSRIYAKLGTDDCLWAALVEKAFAAKYGSYEALDGITAEAVYAGLGLSFWSADNPSASALMSLENDNQSLCIAFDDFNYPPAKKLPGTQVFNYHAYTVISADSALLVLRDPQGADMPIVPYASISGFRWMATWGHA